MSIQELLEEGDTGEAILVVHSDRDGSEAPKVNGTSADGSRSEAKAPRPDTPSTESAANRGAEDSVPTINEYRTEWGVMFHDGSVRRGFNGRTARVRATLEAQRLAELYAPDNIRLVSRPVFVGEWVEQA